MDEEGTKETYIAIFYIYGVFSIYVRFYLHHILSSFLCDFFPEGFREWQHPKQLLK